MTCELGWDNCEGPDHCVWGCIPQASWRKAVKIERPCDHPVNKRNWAAGIGYCLICQQPIREEIMCTLFEHRHERTNTFPQIDIDFNLVKECNDPDHPKEP